MIKAEIVADSTNEFGNRLTTMLITFPRFILAELNTHRMLSKNSASSRAIPFKKMLESVKTNPFIPIAWQVDHPGMQGTKYVGNFQHTEVMTAEWLKARDEAVIAASNLNAGIRSSRAGVYKDDLIEDTQVTKQLCNRLLEPFMWHTVLISGTEWENFFHLRCPQYTFHKEDKEWIFRSKKEAIKFFGEDEVVEYESGDIALKDLTDLAWLKLNEGKAEIHMMALAEAMWDAFNESKPEELKAGQWHVVYKDKIKEMFNLDETDTDIDGIPYVVKIGTMMAARTSYTVFGTELSDWTIDKYVAKANEMATANPLHASPFEHCAKVPTWKDYYGAIRGVDYRVIEDEVHNYTALEKEYGREAMYEEEKFNSMPLIKGKLIHEHFIKEDDVKMLYFGWFGNFRGFIQYRKMLANENKTA